MTDRVERQEGTGISLDIKYLQTIELKPSI